MSKGKVKAYYEHSAGSVTPSDTLSYNYLYETSTVRNPKYNIGDRVVLPDGRVFRYGFATTAIADKNHALKFWNQLDDGVTYVVPDSGQAVGDSSVHLTAAGITLDELRGGYIIVHSHAAHNDQFRGILGNTATDADGDITIFLDAPLTIAVTVAHGIEVIPNPYNNLRVTSADNGVAGDHYSSVAGMPNVLTTAADQYLWVQTWGPCWVNPKAFVPATGRRSVWFDDEGSIVFANANVVTKTLQLAGFLLERDDAGATGAPMVNLQINP